MYVDGDGADVGVGIDIVVDVVVVVDIDIIVGDEGASGFASRAFPSRPVLSRGVSLSSRARGRHDEIQHALAVFCGWFLSFKHVFSASSG